MTKEKRYLNIDEQIEHLKSKGLQIPSVKLARQYLMDIGYYKLINGYKKSFMENKKYVDGTRIDDLYYLYFFDNDLKELLLRHLNRIEVAIKARMTDVISKKYGIREADYLKSENFKPDSLSNSNRVTFSEIRKDIIDTIKKQKVNQRSLMHYSKNYGYYPFWAVANVLSFGTITHLYSKMKQPDQNEIAKTFQVKSDFLESVLIVALLFRNACAHNEVIYHFRTKYSIRQQDQEIFKLFDLNTNDKKGNLQEAQTTCFA